MEKHGEEQLSWKQTPTQAEINNKLGTQEEKPIDRRISNLNKTFSN